MIASVSNVPLLLNEHQPPSDICEDAEFKVFVAGSGTSVSLFIYRFHDSEYWLAVSVVYSDCSSSDVSSPRRSFGLSLVRVAGGDSEVCPV